MLCSYFEKWGISFIKNMCKCYGPMSLLSLSLGIPNGGEGVCGEGGVRSLCSFPSLH